MESTRIREILSRFDAVRLLVVGDIYLDENIFGAVTGISLEAPIPVFEVHERRYNPGAAGNAACNAAALGATTSIAGFIGGDDNGNIVRREFERLGVDATGIVVDPVKPTNTYGKLRAGTHNAPSQEVLRTDTPAPPFVSGVVEDAIVREIETRAKDVDAIVVVDQIASVVTPRVIETIVACAREHGLVTVGDSRSRANALAGIQILVPNDREACCAVGIEFVDEASVHRAGVALLKSSERVLITRGADGITIFEKGQEPKSIPIVPCPVVDVTGAGDTVTATIAVSMAAGATIEEAAVMANRAAGLAVGRPGVVTAPRPELEEALLRGETPEKVKNLNALKERVVALQREGKRVVWTNGCFDILHAGHIAYLKKAACEGDVLVVGLNSDESVRRLKGPKRPVVSEAERAFVLSEFECVDYVTVFPEDSPVNIIAALQPDVYAKGGDYTIESINQEERRIVEGYGGRVAIIPGVEGRSTTRVIEQILSNPGA